MTGIRAEADPNGIQPTGGTAEPDGAEFGSAFEVAIGPCPDTHWTPTHSGV